MLSVWYSFYWEESFEGTHLVCTWNISVLLQQMHIQGEQSRIFIQAYYLDTWRQGALMSVVLWYAYFKAAMAKHMKLIHGMDCEPNSKSHPVVFIYYGKTNTTKEEVEKHIMCQTKEIKNLVVNIVKKPLQTSIHKFLLETHSLELSCQYGCGRLLGIFDHRKMKVNISTPH